VIHPDIIIDGFYSETECIEHGNKNAPDENFGVEPYIFRGKGKWRWYYPKEPNRRENVSTTAEQILVMQGFECGESIQRRLRSAPPNTWLKSYDKESSPNPYWNWQDYDYRIKPVPKVIYVNEYKEGVLDYYYKSKEQAEGSSTARCLRVGVEYKEVIKD
jgi:hypothetical protein